MLKQPPERKRRIPHQKRAGSTVDAILDATLQLLDGMGPERITTNHIAERAGVSVGTIYQYFSDKKAILAAVAERRALALRETITDLVINDTGASVIRKIVRSLADTFKGTPEIREALLDASTQAGAANLRQHHEAFLASITGKVSSPVELTKESAFILTHAPIGLLRAAAMDPEMGLDPLRLEDEVVRLIESYLGALVAVKAQADASTNI